MSISSISIITIIIMINIIIIIIVSSSSRIMIIRAERPTVKPRFYAGDAALAKEEREATIIILVVIAGQCNP